MGDWSALSVLGQDGGSSSPEPLLPLEMLQVLIRALVREKHEQAESHCTFSCSDTGHETPVTARKFPHSGESEAKQ